MPIKDPKKRAEKQAEWRKNHRNPAYFKWLYQRRKLQYRKSELFETALRQIEQEALKEPPRITADIALTQAEAWEMQIGNFFNHETGKPYWKGD